MILRSSAAALVLLALCRGPATMAEPEREHAPHFSLKNMAGQEETLERYRGKLVVLNFWATWCPPCRVEMPEFERLYRDLRSRGLVVVAVSSDAFGARVVGPVVEDLHITFPVLLDVDERVTNLYRVRMRPTTYVIDADGTLLGRIVGPRDWASAEWRKFIERHLPEPSSR